MQTMNPNPPTDDDPEATPNARRTGVRLLDWLVGAATTVLSALLVIASLFGLKQGIGPKPGTLDLRGVAVFFAVVGICLGSVGIVAGGWVRQSRRRGFLLTAGGWGLPALFILSLPLRSSNHDTLPVALFWGTPLALAAVYSIIRMFGLLGPSPSE